MVHDLKSKIQEDSAKEIKKREDLIKLASEMRKQNDINKQMKEDEKKKIKELDV